MRFVIKVGTSLIAPGGRIDALLMRRLVDQLNLDQHEYLIVSSGAIASGMSKLAFTARPKSVQLMQACAAVGQSLLMHTYERLFFGKKVVAQLLLSSDDFTSSLRYENLQNALHELLKLGVVPIVNENDSVSVRELVGAFGDNDELSALLATAVKADWLVLLTNVDGFYAGSGRKQKLVRSVRRLTPEMEALCSGKSALGTGGMRSKLRAAKMASENGVQVAIANGRAPEAIRNAVERKIGTYFPAMKAVPQKRAKDARSRLRSRRANDWKRRGARRRAWQSSRLSTRTRFCWRSPTRSMSVRRTSSRRIARI